MSEELTDKINSLKKKDLLTDKGKLKRPEDLENNDVPTRLRKKKNPYEKKTPAYDDGKYLGNLTSQEIRDYQAEKNESKKTRKTRTKFKVYPSAYANMYASGVCSGKITPGGKKGKRKKAANGGLIVDEDLTMMVDV